MEKPNGVVFLRGRKTILRPICKETDLESFLRWMNDQRVTRYLNRMFPIGAVEEAEILDNMARQNEHSISLAITTLDGTLIGSMGLHGINWKDRTATTGAAIGDPEYWGGGYGTDAKMSLLDYAFHTLNLRRIKSDVIAFNERSQRYNLRCGYKIEGVRRREKFIEGRYYDIIEFGLFKKDWLPVRRLYKKTGRVR